MTEPIWASPASTVLHDLLLQRARSRCGSLRAAKSTLRPSLQVHPPFVQAGDMAMVPKAERFQEHAVACIFPQLVLGKSWTGWANKLERIPHIMERLVGWRFIHGPFPFAGAFDGQSWL